MSDKAGVQKETPILRHQRDLRRATRKFRVVALGSVLAILFVLFGPSAWSSWQLHQFHRELMHTFDGKRALVVVKHHAMLVNHLMEFNPEKATQLFGPATLIGDNGFLKWNWKDDNVTTASIEMTFDESGQNTRLSIGP